MLSLHTPAFLRSGPLMLDAGLRQARSGTRVLAVSGLPLRILELLVEANGRLVSRTELKAKLWPHAVRINVDRRLNTAVRALRKAGEFRRFRDRNKQNAGSLGNEGEFLACLPPVGCPHGLRDGYLELGRKRGDVGHCRT